MLGTKTLWQFIKQQLITAEINASIEKIPKPTGSFGYDPWGYHKEGAKIWMSLFKPLYDHYFRVEAFGLENIPPQGRVLIIANHSGQLPIDGAMIGVALCTNPHGPRAPRAMIERWIPTLPFIGNALNEAGAVIGDPENCAKMLRNEEAVIVFPEGVRGSGKPYQKRYQLQRFGHGFMHLAMQENTPIIPVGVVGCEEAIPSLGNAKTLAKILGMPYLPIAMPFPLPTKIILEFGEPLFFTGEIENEQTVEAHVKTVKQVIQNLIDSGLQRRQGWFK